MKWFLAIALIASLAINVMQSHTAVARNETIVARDETIKVEAKTLVELINAVDANGSIADDNRQAAKLLYAQLSACRGVRAL